MREIRRNEWVTIAEAAARMASGQPRIRQLIHRNKIPKRGREFVYMYRLIEDADHRARHPEARTVDQPV